MRNNRLQNHISESSFTLPLCIVMGLFAWFWSAEEIAFRCDFSVLSALVIAIATTYLVFDTANKFSLLRIRSYMITTVWVIGLALMPFTHTFSNSWIVALCLAGSYYIMFLAYQQYEPIAKVFHAFILLGIASVIVPQLLILVPLYYWYLLVFLRSLSWRSFWAGIVGLVLPMCFILGWCILNRDFSFLLEKVNDLQSTTLFCVEDYQWMLSYRNPKALTFAFMTILSMIGIVHYLVNYFDDKISTRMYLYIYTIQTLAILAMILCMPSMYETLAIVFMLNACVMIAHYFALTGSWVSNALFCLTLLVVVFLLILNCGVWKF